MKVDSYVMYASFYESIKDLDDDVRLKVYDSINEYALNHNEINVDNVLVKSIMALIKPQLDASYSRRITSIENGKKGGRPKKAQSSEELEDKASLMVRNNLKKPIGFEEKNLNVNANVNVNANDNVNVISKKKFIPPTLDEVREYCDERHNDVDYKRFYEYYNIAGWKDSKGNQVKNWKQKMIANWENKKPVVKERMDQEDKEITYDTSNNKKLSDIELNELLNLRRTA